MNALPPNDLRRAVSTAKLLTSDVDGEALGATRALCRLLGKHGLEPAAVLNEGLLRSTAKSEAGFASGSPAAMRPCDVTRSHQRTALMARGFKDLLTDWELGFLDSVVYLRTLSPKQQDRFNAICAKIDRAHQ